jgi:Na+-driven multidrug efflux pump
LTGTPVRQSQSQDVKRELLMLSLPAIAGQALEPLAQLMETAYIGRLGTLWFLYIYIYIYIYFVP